MTKGLELLALLPHLQGGKRGWRLSPITNCQWFNQTSIKAPEQQGSESFQFGEDTEVQGGWRAYRWHGSSAPLPPYIALCIHLFYLAILSCNLYNKPVNIK